MASAKIDLPETLKSWVNEVAKSGSFVDESDYVRDLIRRDRDRQRRIAALQQAVSEGLDSGVSELDMDDLRQKARALAGLASNDTL